ncbi:MAG: 7-carboxy-7-deazaguanine synthase QueE [Gammaproteobacteria bacterium]|nr:7-carboxy-7-deazaguanine synthase QueE [Gammaproteobacteria bacterium]
MTEAPRLRITEIFHSLQGESRTVGLPTTFVRLTGCPLRCVYCDTTYSFQGGEWLALDDVLARVRQFPARHVCVTGGEPLAQKACLNLLTRLCDEGYVVSLETSGALDICQVDSRVHRVMDLKGPSSGEQEKNHLPNIACLNAADEVKFVIAHREDFDWAVAMMAQYQLDARCDVLFSPSFGLIEPKVLAQWILDAGLNVRMQLQLHKLIWGDEKGR